MPHRAAAGCTPKENGPQHNRSQQTGWTTRFTPNAPRAPSASAVTQQLSAAHARLVPPSSSSRKHAAPFGQRASLHLAGHPAEGARQQEPRRGNLGSSATPLQKCQGRKQPSHTVRKWPSTQLRPVSHGRQASAGTSHAGAVQRLREHKHPSSQAPHTHGRAVRPPRKTPRVRLGLAPEASAARTHPARRAPGAAAGDQAAVRFKSTRFSQGALPPSGLLAPHLMASVRPSPASSARRAAPRPGPRLWQSRPASPLGRCPCHRPPGHARALAEAPAAKAGRPGAEPGSKVKEAPAGLHSSSAFRGAGACLPFLGLSTLPRCVSFACPRGGAACSLEKAVHKQGCQQPCLPVIGGAASWEICPLPIHQQRMHTYTGQLELLQACKRGVLAPSTLNMQSSAPASLASGLIELTAHTPPC